jgi:quinoprotein glucose dehydrogenase
MRKLFAASTLMAAIAVLTFGCTQKKDYNGWPQYKGSNENIHYSSLTEVDTGNVKQLQVAWTYHTRDADSANHSQIQCNPIVIDGVMYGTTPKMKLFAIDAATGQEKWQFNPFDSLAKDKRMFFIMNNSRGVAYWGNGDDKRVFYAAGPYLYCINAATGKTVNSFGDKGKLDLHDGLGRDVADLFITASSPPIIYGDIIIMGTRVDEGSHAAPGHIRAYNVRTGKQLWIFHTIPANRVTKHGKTPTLINLLVALMFGAALVWMKSAV